MNIICNGFQGFEVGDLIQAVACCFQKFFVDDDAEALIAVTDGAELAVSVIQIVCVGLSFFCNRGSCQIIAVVSPCLDACLIAYDKQGRSRGLVHFRS